MKVKPSNQTSIPLSLYLKFKHNGNIVKDISQVIRIGGDSSFCPTWGEMHHRVITFNFHLLLSALGRNIASLQVLFMLTFELAGETCDPASLQSPMPKASEESEI